MRVFLLLCCAVVAAAAVPRAQAPVVTDVTAAQVMLDRLGFSSGEIDGRVGANVKGALTAFQQAQGLRTTGQLDTETWQRLTEESGGLRPLITYEVTEADVVGPFTPEIPRDLMQQSKLPALGYRNALEALAEKFHASPALLRQINPSATFERAGEQITVPNVIVTDTLSPAPQPARGRGGRARGAGRGGTAPVGTAGAAPVTIYVTKATSALTVEQDGKVIFHAPVTSGSEHDPLPIGTWKVTAVQRNPVFNYNPDLFWDANPAHSKAKIPSGPNNPVGVLWIDLSKEHYGIHGTPEPSQIGHVESHGCVRLTNWDAQRVAAWARPGTAVIFR